MSAVSSKTQTSLASSVSGSGVLHGTCLFDFESGAETAGPADVWWDQQTSTERQMVPVGGAALCILGLANYDALIQSDLKALSYSNTPIPGNVGGPNRLVDGSVFAVRTRSGKFVKVQVLHYDYNLQIRWQLLEREINYLDVKITLGSAPAWLVTRYAVPHRPGNKPSRKSSPTIGSRGPGPSAATPPPYGGCRRGPRAAPAAPR